MIMHHNWIRFVGVIEIYGGVNGIINLLRKIPADISLHVLLPNVLISCAYALSIIAGVLLLEVDYRGLTSSKLIQFIQIPVITVQKISVCFASGAYIQLIVTPSISLQADLQSYWTYKTLVTPTPIYGCNLLACLALGILFAANIVEEKTPDKTENKHPVMPVSVNPVVAE